MYAAALVHLDKIQSAYANVVRRAELEINRTLSGLPNVAADWGVRPFSMSCGARMPCCPVPPSSGGKTGLCALGLHPVVRLQCIETLITALRGDRLRAVAGRGGSAVQLFLLPELPGQHPAGPLIGPTRRGPRMMPHR